MGPSTSDSSPPMRPLEASAQQRPKILEGLGGRVSLLAHIFARKARDLPIIGNTIAYVEDTLKPWLGPVITLAEEDGMYMLSLVDKQIYTVSDVAVAHIPLASKVVPRLQTLLSGQPVDPILSTMDMVLTKGVMETIADIWVKYEPIVESKTKRISNLALRTPCLKLVVFIMQDIATPLVSLASDLLVGHCEIEDKHQILLADDSHSPLDSPITPGAVSKAFQNMDGDTDYKTATEESELPPSDGAEEVAFKASDAKQDKTGEIDVFPVKDEEGPSPTSSDAKGKSPEVIVVYEDDEDHDEVTDLFDTWGMGLKAISPKGLKTIRTVSLKEASNGSRRGEANPFMSLSKSLKF